MPAIAVRMIRSEARARLVERAQEGLKEVQAALYEEIAEKAKAKMQEIVANWEHAPDFGISKNVTPDGIEVFVEPIGPNQKYWWWTSRGTRPHIILPGEKTFTGKHRKQLIFQPQYTPKTTPAPSWGGPGSHSGKFVFAGIVHHPGTEPRHFEEYIYESMKAEFAEIMNNAFKRGLRREG